MIDLNEEEAQIIIILSDEKGHTNREIASMLGKSKGRVSNILKSMKAKGIIYEEKQRRTTNPEVKGNYSEIPIYINLDHPIIEANINSEETPINIDLDVFNTVLSGLMNSYRNLNNTYASEFGSDAPFLLRCATKYKDTVSDDSVKHQLDCLIQSARRELEEITNKKKANKDSLYKLLFSPYAVKLIKKYGFIYKRHSISFYDLIKDYLPGDEDVVFRFSLLLQFRAVVEEYSLVPKQLRESINAAGNQSFMPALNKENHISILANFDPSKAIRLHRQTLKDELISIYKESSKDCGSKGITDFIELDIHLSPITSYPINFPPSLLLRHPFDRIFNESYIFNKDDFEKLVMRAFIFYKNFSEIFMSAIQYELVHPSGSERNPSLGKDKMITDSIVRQAIFYWNVSSFNFDWVCANLENRLGPDKTGEFYINLVDQGIFIKDLDYFLFDESSYIKRNMLVNGYFIYGAENISDYLRPCEFFKRMGLNADSMSYERIASEFSALFDKHDR